MTSCELRALCYEKTVARRFPSPALSFRLEVSDLGFRPRGRLSRSQPVPAAASPGRFCSRHRSRSATPRREKRGQALGFGARPYTWAISTKSAGRWPRGRAVPNPPWRDNSSEPQTPKPDPMEIHTGAGVAKEFWIPRYENWMGFPGRSFPKVNPPIDDKNVCNLV